MNPRTQTHDAGVNLAWKIQYSVKDGENWSDTCSHDNYAEGISQALFAFHQWMQHLMDCKPEDYKVLKVFRTLRKLDKQTGEYCWAGEVEQKDLVPGNPTTPPIRQEKTEDKTQPFNFMDQIPVAKKVTKNNQKS